MTAFTSGRGQSGSVGGYDSEWDLVHGRIARHRDEIRRLASKRGSNGPHKALDLACGTGKHIIELAKLGYQCVGIDRVSWKVAKASDDSRALGLEIEFFCADLRTFDTQPQFDLVICLYAMSLMRTDADVLAAFGTAKRALRRSGRFVFNVINREASRKPRSPVHQSIHATDHLRDFDTGELRTLLCRAQLNSLTLEFREVAGIPNLDVFVHASL